MVANAGTAVISRVVDCMRILACLESDVLTLGSTVNLSDWNHCMNVNLGSVMLCYKYAARQMIQQCEGGRILGTY